MAPVLTGSEFPEPRALAFAALLGGLAVRDGGSVTGLARAARPVVGEPTDAHGRAGDAAGAV